MQQPTPPRPNRRRMSPRPRRRRRPSTCCVSSRMARSSSPARPRPGPSVEIVTGSKVLGKVEAGPTGDFVAVLDEPLKPGDYQIVLRAIGTGCDRRSSVETAVVSVPEDKNGQVLALVEQPGAPSKLIRRRQRSRSRKSRPTLRPRPHSPTPARQSRRRRARKQPSRPPNSRRRPPVSLGEAIQVVGRGGRDRRPQDFRGRCCACRHDGAHLCQRSFAGRREIIARRPLPARNRARSDGWRLHHPGRRSVARRLEGSGARRRAVRARAGRIDRRRRSVEPAPPPADAAAPAASAAAASGSGRRGRCRASRQMPAKPRTSPARRCDPGPAGTGCGRGQACGTCRTAGAGRGRCQSASSTLANRANAGKAGGQSRCAGRANAAQAGR